MKWELGLESEFQSQSGGGKTISCRAEAAAPRSFRVACSSACVWKSGDTMGPNPRPSPGRQTWVLQAHLLFSKYLSAYFMPGTVLSTGDTAVTEKAKRLLREFVLIKFHSSISWVPGTAQGAEKAVVSQVVCTLGVHIPVAVERDISRRQEFSLFYTWGGGSTERSHSLSEVTQLRQSECRCVNSLIHHPYIAAALSI